MDDKRLQDSLRSLLGISIWDCDAQLCTVHLIHKLPGMGQHTCCWSKPSPTNNHYLSHILVDTPNRDLRNIQVYTCTLQQSFSQYKQHLDHMAIEHKDLFLLHLAQQLST